MTQPSLSLARSSDRPVRRELSFRPLSSLKNLPTEPPWLWQGLLVPGSLTMLAGHPFAGKSTLVAGLLKAFEQGLPFLGRGTERATAVLVTEEDDHGLHSRGHHLGLPEGKSVYLGRSNGVLAIEWAELIEAATRCACEKGHSLLVIDTLPGLAGLGPEQENDAGAIGERLRPLQQAAAEDLAVLFLHHMNGYGKPRGSKAFRGVVDIELLFQRGKGNTFTIDSVSRFASSLPPRLKGELVKAGDDWLFQSLENGRSSTTKGAGRSDTDSLLHAALLAAGDAGLTYGEIDCIEGLSEHMAKRRFPSWHEQGKIGKRGGGKKGNPIRWFMPAA